MVEVFVFVVLALLFGAVAVWGGMGMLQVLRKRYEGGNGVKAAEGRVPG